MIDNFQCSVCESAWETREQSVKCCFRAKPPKWKPRHLFSSTQVERLADRIAGDASRDRPAAITPHEARVIIALLRDEFGRMEAALRT